MEIACCMEHNHECSCGQHGQRDACLNNSHGCSCGQHSQRDAIDTDLSCCFHGNSCSHNDFHAFSNDYESRYYQLMTEKEEMERSYERERRERHLAEQKFKQKLEEKSLIEDKFSNLNQSLQRYDEDLNVLRHENEFLKGQFDSLKNAINSRMSSKSAIGDTTYFVSSPLHSTSVNPLTESVDTDSYKHEVAVLANENDLLRQIIDIINQQSQEKASWDERASEKYTVDRKWQSDPEVTRLQEENSKLKSRIRELERSRREQESEMEEVTLDLEDKTRKTKTDMSRLEEDIHSKSLLVEDLESQLYRLKMEYHEEMQKWELKLEAEILMKTQIQEEVNVLQGTVRNLEEERIELVTKLEELYNSENDIIQARNDLEARFSEEICELQARLEAEVRTKIELSQEMTGLMNEFVDLRNKSKQMEEMYLREIEVLRLNASLQTGAEGPTVQYDGNPNVAIGTYLTQHQHTNSFSKGQRFPQQGTVSNDIQSQLNREIQKREALEKENKDLLYKMKNILSNADQASGEKIDHQIDLSVGSSSTNETRTDDSSNTFKKKIRVLENKVAELTEECETLQRCAKKGREVEKMNKELMNELDELSSERDGMLRKQRSLVSEVERSSSSLQDFVEKNRRLMDEIDSNSRKIRDMEDNFRQDRNSLIRRFDKEKSLEIKDIQKKKKDLENQLDDQIRENRKLEYKVRDLEDGIRYLKQSNGHANITSWSYTSDNNKDTSDLNKSRGGMDQTVGDLGQDTRRLEQMLQERKKIEEDHVKTLEDQRKQLRNDFEMEKQKLRQCFEEEKRDLTNRLTAVVSQPGGLPGIADGRGFGPSSVVQNTYYTPSGQIRQPVSQNTGSIHPIAQRPMNPQDMISNQQHSCLDTQMLTSTTLSCPVTHQQSQSSPQPHSVVPHYMQQHLPYPQHHSGQVTGSIVYPQGVSGTLQDSQLDDNLNKLQQEVQRLSAEKKDMEKRLKDMERRMDDNPSKMSISFDPKMSITARDSTGRDRDDQKEYISFGVSSDNMPGRSHQSSSIMDYNANENIDGKLQVTMKKLVEEHRQHSDELRRQIKLQKDSFEKEKIKMQREHAVLLGNIRSLKKEVHILKHEREDMREKLKRERMESHMREERFKDELTTVRKEYDVKIKQEIEKSERKVKELQRKISISERTMKEIEIKFKDKVTQIEKRYSQERMNLEAKLRDTENNFRSRLEFHYQAKMNSEKEKYESTLKDLRKEIKYLQAQRKEIQLKLSADSGGSTVTTEKETVYNISLQNKDFYKSLEKEIEIRFAQEKRRFENTIRELSKEVEELKKEKRDMKSCYKEEKVEVEEHFEREKRRMEERYRNDIDELKRTIDRLQDDNIKIMRMQSAPEASVRQHQKNITNPYAVIQKSNTSLELKNSELESDIAYLKGRLSNLESRQTKLLVSQNDKPLTVSDRKVKFSLVNNSKGQMRRSFSFTDLRNVAGTGNTRDTSFSSVRPGFSRDDQGLSFSRLSSSGMAGSLAGYYSGMTGFQGNGYARSAEIAHIPSTGILSGAMGHGLGCSRGASVGYLGGNSAGATLGLSSGIHSGIGIGSALSGNNSWNTSSVGVLSGNGAGNYQAAGAGFLSSNAIGNGSARYLSSHGCESGSGALSSKANGTGSGEASGFGSGFRSVGVGGGGFGSSFLTGSLGGSSSRLLSSNTQGESLSSGYLASSALGSNVGINNTNSGMQSSLISGQRTLGLGQVSSGSFGGGSLGIGGTSGMSCTNCTSQSFRTS